MGIRGIAASFILLVASCTTVSAANTCYFPNGNIATENVPCSSDGHSACCGTGDICLSNNLCMDTAEQPYVLSRGACTDPDWESENCPSVCRACCLPRRCSLSVRDKLTYYGLQLIEDVNKSGGSSIINLLYVDGVSTYCCGTPISNGSDVICPYGNSFEVATGKMIVGYAGLANLTTKRNDTASSTNCSSSSTSLPSASSSASSSSSGSSGSSSKDTAIGVGVGVPLGVIASAAIVWGAWERKQRRRLQQIASAGGNSMFEQQQYSVHFMKTPADPAELEVDRMRHELQS
ncbi:hypothetical protein BO94DRAFT_540463 [Aspergillus sclerotioniger CBS 115572]|uniref:Mid2 domain-containing protein n=1 Tax=Aspergillus sclerotioniger CBS 115572 TaxID=1450535 RepID=A0A317V2I0_9EURO|nr:hypothetical protein BO94DRAFT_540463 [Aspergillus sclerotioniger CBS 115572]PWY67248.1 hypothetical protein BO94DRAFT_540463 [Aspergillus sclerotioniger CBS 115572]